VARQYEILSLAVSEKTCPCRYFLMSILAVHSQTPSTGPCFRMLAPTISRPPSSSSRRPVHELWAYCRVVLKLLFKRKTGRELSLNLAAASR